MTRGHLLIMVNDVLNDFVLKLPQNTVETFKFHNLERLTRCVTSEGYVGSKIVPNYITAQQIDAKL